MGTPVLSWRGAACLCVLLGPCSLTRAGERAVVIFTGPVPRVQRVGALGAVGAGGIEFQPHGSAAMRAYKWSDVFLLRTADIDYSRARGKLRQVPAPASAPRVFGPATARLEFGGAVPATGCVLHSLLPDEVGLEMGKGPPRTWPVRLLAERLPALRRLVVSSARGERVFLLDRGNGLLLEHLPGQPAPEIKPTARPGPEVVRPTPVGGLPAPLDGASLEQLFQDEPRRFAWEEDPGDPLQGKSAEAVPLFASWRMVIALLLGAGLYCGLFSMRRLFRPSDDRATGHSRI